MKNKVNLGETGAQSQRIFIFSLLFISHSVCWYCDISRVKDIPPPVLIVVCVNECVFYPAVLRIHTQYQRTPPECSVLPPSPSAHHPSWNTQDRADSSPSPLDTRDWNTHTIVIWSICFLLVCVCFSFYQKLTWCRTMVIIINYYNNYYLVVKM